MRDRAEITRAAEAQEVAEAVAARDRFRQFAEAVAAEIDFLRGEFERRVCEAAE